MHKGALQMGFECLKIILELKKGTSFLFTDELNHPQAIGGTIWVCCYVLDGGAESPSAKRFYSLNGGLKLKVVLKTAKKV